MTGGDATIGFPRRTTQSAEHPAVRRALNSRELMEERALFPCDRSETAVFSASIQWYESSSPTQSRGSRSHRTNSGSFTIPASSPICRDGNIGGVKIIQDEDFYQTIEPINITATGVHTNSNGEYVYNYYTVRPLTASRAHERVGALSRRHGADARRAEQCAEQCGIKRQYGRERPRRINASRKGEDNEKKELSSLY